MRPYRPRDPHDHDVKRRTLGPVPYVNAVLLDLAGNVAEFASSNLFLVTKDGTVVTPALNGTFLAGITRDLVRDLARETAIPCEEAELCPEDLAGCDEAFFTSSVIEIMPLVSVRLTDGTTVTFNEGKPGEVTRRLMAAYAARVKRETGG